MKTVTVKDLVIGTGAPKIIVSLMAKDIASVKSEASPIVKRTLIFWNGVWTTMPTSPMWSLSWRQQNSP